MSSSTLTCIRPLASACCRRNILKVNDVDTGVTVLTASFKKWVLPEKKDHVNFPDRRRLKIIEKVPNIDPGVRPPKMMKDLHLMRGPELVHNKLQYGDYGIQAVTGGRLDHKVCEAVRMIVIRQMDDKKCFALWRHQKLWQAVSKKGQGQRGGGGKGAIDRYVFPFQAERIILEVGGYAEYIEVLPLLESVRRVLPFRSRIVTHEKMQKRQEAEKWEEENNLNPFTFKYCANNNVLGCSTILSRYDHMWHGKYR